jgi:hypothetical protein
MPNGRPSAKSLENLKKGKKFQKGQSGNPNGAPRKIPELDELIGKVLSDSKGDMTAAEAVLRSLLAKATSSTHNQSVRAAEVLLERGWGKVQNNVDITSQGKAIQQPLIHINGNPPADTDNL